MSVVPSPDPYGPDIIEGLMQVLLADPATSALVGTQVFDTEIGQGAGGTKTIVVRPHGGPRPDASLQLSEVRVQLMTFGESPHLAHVVYVAAYNALKNLTPSVWAGTYIHSCKPQAGPIPYRDVELQWPYLISMWLVRHSDVPVAA